MLQNIHVIILKSDYNIDKVDIQVLSTIGVWDIWNYSIINSEFGDHFVSSVFDTFRYNKILLSALALISGIYRIYLDRYVFCNSDLHHVD